MNEDYSKFPDVDPPPRRSGDLYCVLVRDSKGVRWELAVVQFRSVDLPTWYFYNPLDLRFSHTPDFREHLSVIAYEPYDRNIPSVEKLASMLKPLP